MEPVFQCGWILTIHESMGSNKTGKLLTVTPFSFAMAVSLKHQSDRLKCLMISAEKVPQTTQQQDPGDTCCYNLCTWVEISQTASAAIKHTVGLHYISSGALDCLCQQGSRLAVQLEREWGTRFKTVFVFTDIKLLWLIFGRLLRIIGRWGVKFPEVPFDKYLGLMVLLRFESRGEGHGVLEKNKAGLPQGLLSGIMGGTGVGLRPFVRALPPLQHLQLWQTGDLYPYQ